MSEAKPRLYWIGPGFDCPPEARSQEMSIVAAKQMQERVELDEFGPALYERREDAEAVLDELRRRFPSMQSAIVM